MTRAIADSSFQQGMPGRFKERNWVKHQNFSARKAYNGRVTINDKAKPAESRRQKATRPRFLREATDDSPMDPETVRPMLKQTASNLGGRS